MKKIVLGALAVCAVVVFAETVPLDWVFTGYFETLSASEYAGDASVDTTLQVSDEAELDIDSSSPGMAIIVR